jgi:thioredoxin-like negative regulator of GroEL
MAVMNFDSQTDTRNRVSKRPWRWTIVVCCAAALVCTGWTWWSVRSYKSAMAAVDFEMAAGKFGMAARTLEQVLAGRPQADEAAYVLGLCEQARGKPQAAQQAWARVAPGSAFFHRAILAGLRLFHDTGQLAASERLVTTAAQDPRADRTDLRVLLVPIFSQIGRSDEAERLIEDRWEHLLEIGEATPEQSIKLVRLHIELTGKAPSPDALRIYLDQVGRLSPDDDRCWLGRAHLAIQTGALDEAKGWLDACLWRRPEDAPVWRASLKWGLASQRVDVVRQAMKHLPAAEATHAAVDRLNAWLCARRTDVECERQALERLNADDPGDATAALRLVQLAEKGGQPEVAARSRQHSEQTDRLRIRYQELYDRTQHMRDAEEMARIADQLGRWFEARVFLTLALVSQPERTDLKSDLKRVSSKLIAPGVPGQTLAQVVAHELGEGR